MCQALFSGILRLKDKLDKSQPLGLTDEKKRASQEGLSSKAEGSVQRKEHCGRTARGEDPLWLEAGRKKTESLRSLLKRWYWRIEGAAWNSSVEHECLGCGG